MTATFIRFDQFKEQLLFGKNNIQKYSFFYFFVIVDTLTTRTRLGRMGSIWSGRRLGIVVHLRHDDNGEKNF